MSVTAIEWSEQTWNPLAGCTPVSPGCLNCYAATMAARLEAMGQTKYAGLTVMRNGVRTFNGKINTDEPALRIPLNRKKPTTYFVNSMSDLFHERVPFDFVDRVFAVMAICPQHTFQVLTKRPERMREYMALLAEKRAFRTWQDAGAAFGVRNFTGPREWPSGRLVYPLPNVWLGTSIENRKSLDRAMDLSACPAAVHFWSLEPLLEDLGNIRGYLEQNVEWVIVGGESGHGARACNVEWVRSIVHQCGAAGVACFVKQLGAAAHDAPNGLAGRSLEVSADVADRVSNRLKSPKGGDPAEWPADLRVREMPTDPATMIAAALSRPGAAEDLAVHGNAYTQGGVRVDPATVGGHAR